MENFGAVATMARPKTPKRPDAKKTIGRPKADTPMKSIVSLKGSEDLEVWLDELTEHTESGTRTNALRRALKAFAERESFEKPIPKR